MDVNFLADTFIRLLRVAPTSLMLFVLSVSAGGCLALGLVWMRVSGNWLLQHIARTYIFIFRGSPLLIQMFLIYYGLGQFDIVQESFVWPVLRDPFNCAAISLALSTAAYTAEIFRGGLLAVPHQQVEAGRACGMSSWLLFRRIVAPLALRHCLPAYSTELVLMVKATSLASLVTVAEVTGIANKIIHTTYRSFEVLFCAAIIYLFLNFVLVQALLWIERRLSPDLRERPGVILEKVRTGLPSRTA